MEDVWWHLTVRKYGSAGPPEEIGGRVERGVAPVLRAQPGFRAYLGARLDGGGGVFSVTVFEDRAALAAANERVRAWAGNNLRDLLPEPPEVITADVTVHRGAAEASGRDGYVSVRTTEGLGPPSRVLPEVQRLLVPLVTAQPGFRRFYAGRDEAAPDRSVAVYVFKDRDTTTAAQEQVAALMARHREVWPHPPRTLMAGQTLFAFVA
jgi:quinol monooxygenase YgiN